MKAFLSHSSADKPLAREIAQEIRARGHEVWLDERELQLGQPLASALSEAMRTIDAFVVVLTANSVASKWVSFELAQALPLAVESAVRMVPLKFGDITVPALLRGYIFADCSSPDGLRRALNLAFLKSPLDRDEISSRFERRVVPEYCVRLVPSDQLSCSGTLGPAVRKYVGVGDYMEQCGRTLHEILSNLLSGATLDNLIEPDGAFSAVVFEAGSLFRKKLDLLPATWKAVYRILTDHRRLNVWSPAQYYADLGPPPRDYWDSPPEWSVHLSEELSRNLMSQGYPEFSLAGFLQETFGIRGCFDGNGRGLNGCRVFFVRNLALQDIRHWVVDLGKPAEGNILN
jgi:hypothetical protein